MIAHYNDTVCSVDLDSDRCETEIDFRFGMKRLTFELSLIRVYRQKYNQYLVLIKIDRPRCVLFTCLTFKKVQVLINQRAVHV